ncbi:MAG: FumA C-terminus/TtdB family hydratase beta subunit [Candidatus Bathyarchaeia archaeon]
MAIYKLRTPISEREIRILKVNDVLYITGTVVTARDQAHKKAIEQFKHGKSLPINLQGLAVYHCGPIVRWEGDRWVVVAAGPTTSTRMEVFETEFIKNFGVRVVVGKGGMGRKTTDVMAKYGAVYGAFTGGAAVLAAKTIKSVERVEWLDLGTTEAIWVFEVENFGPLTVAIDSHGNNIYLDVQRKAEENKRKIYRMFGLPP